jgi:hypothetical protein
MNIERLDDMPMTNAIADFLEPLSIEDDALVMNYGDTTKVVIGDSHFFAKTVDEAHEQLWDMYAEPGCPLCGGALSEYGQCFDCGELDWNTINSDIF